MKEPSEIANKVVADVLHVFGADSKLFSHEFTDYLKQMIALPLRECQKEYDGLMDSMDDPESEFAAKWQDRVSSRDRKIVNLTLEIERLETVQRLLCDETRALRAQVATQDKQILELEQAHKDLKALLESRERGHKHLIHPTNIGK